MIVDERLVTYINSLDRGNTPVLDEIEKEALRDFVPIIRKEMQSFLKLLLAMQKPMRILEVGTAVGFSAVLMAEYAPKGCQIVTIENYEKRIPIAKANFERAGKKITPKLLLEAIRTLPEEKRKAVLLYYFEGMNDTEIAELFDTSRSTIQYRRTSSFELLKKYLEENADEWDEW